LVTSRTSGNWIFPKGNRVSVKSKRKTALQEAFEEAGVIGRLDKKGKMRILLHRPDHNIDLTLYPMCVEKILKIWPEQHQRLRTIVSSKKAIMLLRNSELRHCIKQWNKGL